MRPCVWCDSRRLLGSAAFLSSFGVLSFLAVLHSEFNYDLNIMLTVHVEINLVTFMLINSCHSSFLSVCERSDGHGFSYCCCKALWDGIISFCDRSASVSIYPKRGFEGSTEAPFLLLTWVLLGPFSWSGTLLSKEDQSLCRSRVT